MKKEYNKKELERLFKKYADNFLYKEGIKEFEKILNYYPYKNNKEIYEYLLIKLGFLYDHLALKDKKNRKEFENKALKFYKKVLGKNKNSIDAIWGIGRVWWHRNDKKAIDYAKKAYQLAKNIEPNHYLRIQNIGLVYESLGDYKKAEKWLLKGIEKKPEDFSPYLNLVVFYRLIKDFDKSKKYAKELERLYKKEPYNFRKTNWGKIIKEVIEKADRELEKIKKAVEKG